MVGDITVFAAASLTDTFIEIGNAFTTKYSDAHVRFSFGASSDLANQINQGAPADVFASADQKNMDKLTSANNSAMNPAVFAKNSLSIIVAKGNPEGITKVADLANPDLIVVTCGPEVPIGKYSAEVFKNAGVTVTPKSYEQNVKGIVTKVTLGEADAGIVYVTDVLAATNQADGVEIPANINVIAQYPLTITKNSTNKAVAQVFINFVMSTQGQDILAGHGFATP